jgi:hypothetical protein
MRLTSSVSCNGVSFCISILRISAFFLRIKLPAIHVVTGFAVYARLPFVLESTDIYARAIPVESLLHWLISHHLFLWLFILGPHSTGRLSPLQSTLAVVVSRRRIAGSSSIALSVLGFLLALDT